MRQAWEWIKIVATDARAAIVGVVVLSAIAFAIAFYRGGAEYPAIDSPWMEVTGEHADETPSPSEFVWGTITLSPAEESPIDMTMLRHKDGPMTLVLDEKSKRIKPESPEPRTGKVYCCEHGGHVYDFSLRKLRGNLLYVSLTDLEGTLQYEFWLMPDNPETVDSNGIRQGDAFAQGVP